MSEWFDLVKSSQSIAVLTHINSDGDANGSAMAMYHMLKSLKKDVYLFVPMPINKSYEFLGSAELSGKRNLARYDLAITVDAPTTKRLGEFECEFFKAKNSVCIDHHGDNEFYADVNVVVPDASSACEVVFDLFQKENIDVDKQIATCLYTGISTDTGGFMRSTAGAVSQNTWDDISKLCALGADTATVNYNLFSLIRKNVFELFKIGIGNVEFYEGGKIAMVCLPKEIFDATKTDVTDTYKLIDMVSGIEGVEIMAIISQKSDREQVVSVRVRNNHSARNICAHFGGGGHQRASGCRIFVPLSDAKQQLLKQCRDELVR